MIHSVDDYLSSVESIMWRVGQDPALRMTVGALMILDRSPTKAAFADRVLLAAQRAPRLRRRPDDPTFRRMRPAWIDEREVDVEYHARSVAIASPGSLRQVLDLVALLEPVPFDATRPPWDCTLIEGLEDGRAAMYVRAHHVVTDGIGGIRLAGAFFDEPGCTANLEAASMPTDRPTERRERKNQQGHERRPRTVTIDLTKVTHQLRRRVDAARDAEALDTVVRGFQRALDVTNSVSRQMMVTGGPLSHLFADQSMISRIEILSIPRARQRARAVGGSRNDLLVAGAANGLGRYHERMGKPTAELRLATPACQGRSREVGGNWFAPARVAVPTGPEHRGPLFGMVAERLAQSRREPALRLTSALAWTINCLPTRLLLRAVRAQADSVDFAATALPGVGRDHKICGSLVETTYPFGPRLGCPLNITALGNDDRLDIGMALDPAAITEPGLFLRCLDEAFDGYTPDADTSPGTNRKPLEQVLR
jgi:diacylglycerol O-acyltransferase